MQCEIQQAKEEKPEAGKLKKRDMRRPQKQSLNEELFKMPNAWSRNKRRPINQRKTLSNEPVEQILLKTEYSNPRLQNSAKMAPDRLMN
nr:hypothetical protein BaRGS_020050 [Batillaria attramentaria]